jgi:hypothetical protein
VVAWASRQVWRTSQSFPETDLAGICGRVSDGLATIVEWPLTEAGRGLGIPGPVDAAGAAIGAGLILEPVTRPLAEAARLCEIIGVGIGLLTGCHPLALASAKLLAESRIHEEMAQGLLKAGKLVFHGELPAARAEPGDRPAVAEPSQDRERLADRWERDGTDDERYVDPFWAAGRDEDEPGREVNRDRDDDDWGRGERT